jgi:sulfatase modifying factor 1
MKRHALFVALLCSSALFITASCLNALTIPASEDSYTAAGNKLSYSTNNANGLVVDGIRKAYLFFDLSDIPNDAVVRWAKLRLFLPTVRTAGAGLSVHLVTGTWNESTRLADVPSIVSGSLGMIEPSRMASRRFVTVDVKDTVQKWINGGTLNEGFAIQTIVKAGSPTASVMLTSKEGPVFGLPAELDIEFQPEGGVDKPVTLGQLPSDIRALLTPPPLGYDQLSQSIKGLLSPTVTVQPVIPPSPWGRLSVKAQGVGNLSYQWMRNGVAIVGATNSELPVEGGLQSGIYTAVVSNGLASVSSEGVQITAPKITDSFALVNGGTLPASSPAVIVGTFYIGKTEVTWGDWQLVRTWAVANGYTDLADVGLGMGNNYPVTQVNWFDVVKWCNARSEKEGRTPVYKNGAAVYRTGMSYPQIISSADGYRLPNSAEWQLANAASIWFGYSGSTNLDEVGWYIGNSGGSAHEVGMKLPNEWGIHDMSGNVWEWIFETGDLGTLAGGDWSSFAEEILNGWTTNRFFRQDVNGSRTVNFGFRVATSGEYAIGITAQPSVTLDSTNISVQAAGAGTVTYQWMLNGVAIAGGTSSQLPTQGLQSGTYSVVVSNGFASLTSDSIAYVALAITAQPSLLTLNGGNISVQAEGSGTLTYQWMRNGVAIAGGTSSQLPTQGLQSGTYSVVTSQGFSSLTSGSIAYVALAITAQPSVSSDGTMISVQAEGSGTLTYQWTRNGVAIAGGTSSQLPTQGLQSGTYSVATSNGFSSLTSGSIVYVALAITAQPSVSSDASTINVHVEGTVPFIYQWMYNGEAIAGGTGAQLSTQGLQKGNYTVGVSNGFSILASGSVAYVPLTIIAHPSLALNGTSISVQAEGSGTLTYQWMRDGVPVSGGTNASLATQGLQSGTYTVVVSRAFVSVTSNSLQFSKGFALVTGGTLPSSSELGTLAVNTFYIGKTEVTRGEWMVVRTWAVANGYTGLIDLGAGVEAENKYPVSGVDWYSAVKWCNARSEMEGKTPVYMDGTAVYRSGTAIIPTVVSSANGYRLPSEKEWEFAARGGMQTQGYTYSGSDDLNMVGWYASNSNGNVSPVGMKLANPLGIFDMSGNLCEWCFDEMVTNTTRVSRGGFFKDFATNCTVTVRGHDYTNSAGEDNGFRVALSAAP